jgi:alpha-glucuronidase
MPLDGTFAENVIVQTKLGPMDFQVREPAFPLLTALGRTRQAVEVQITREYTGQQKDLCFLHPQWHEVMSSPAVTGGQATTSRAVRPSCSTSSGAVGSSTSGRGWRGPGWRPRCCVQHRWPTWRRW